MRVVARQQWQGMVLFCLLDGAEPIATVQAWDWNDAVWLVALKVDERHRRNGYGTRLLQEVIARARGRRGVKTVRLNVDRNNHGAFRLYERIGFRVDPGFVDPDPDVIGMIFELEASCVVKN